MILALFEKSGTMPLSKLKERDRGEIGGREIHGFNPA
jgi:hypothetical protein